LFFKLLLKHILNVFLHLRIHATLQGYLLLYVVSFGTSSVQPFEFVNQFGMTIWPWPVL